MIKMDYDLLLAIIIAFGSAVLGGILIRAGMPMGWISLAVSLFASFAAGWIADQAWRGRFDKNAD